MVIHDSTQIILENIMLKLISKVMCVTSFSLIMNALAVQGPCHKCDLGNKNNHWQENNYRQYLTVIVIITLRLYYTLYIIMCVQLTLLWLHNSRCSARWNFVNYDYSNPLPTWVRVNNCWQNCQVLALFSHFEEISYSWVHFMYVIQNLGINLVNFSSSKGTLFIQLPGLLWGLWKITHHLSGNLKDIGFHPNVVYPLRPVE